MVTGGPALMLAFIPSMGWPEMLMIFAVILLIFGPQKLPQIADALGKSIRKFRQAATEIRSDIESDETRKPDKD